MKIPPGIPRLVFVLYIVGALATFSILALIALGAYAHNTTAPFLIAGINFVLIFSVDKKDLRSGKGILMFAEYSHKAPWSTAGICLLHAFFTAWISIWGIFHLSPDITVPLFIVLGLAPGLLTFFVWWFFSVSGMLLSWIFRKE